MALIGADALIQQSSGVNCLGSAIERYLIAMDIYKYWVKLKDSTAAAAAKSTAGSIEHFC